MARVPVFFISATTHDLGSYRETAAQALRDRELQVVIMSHFSPDHRQLREMLQQKMAPCDAVVCLIGFHYGAEPPGAPAAPRRSYTQWEYFIARELKKPVYLLFATETTPWDKPPAESEELRQRQIEFRHLLVGTGQRRDSFSSKEQLRDLALRIPAPRQRSAAVWWWLVTVLAIAGALLWTKPWQPHPGPLGGDTRSPEKPRVSVRDASKVDPFVNSLKMRFVPLPGEPSGGKLLSIWETRNSDWSAAGLKSGTIGKPNEPVSGVTPVEAFEFCGRLTHEERSSGTIPAGWGYRLPTVDEWSSAARETDTAAPTYPWGDTWPPEPGMANLRGEESVSGSDLPNDGYVGVAPVGSFRANANGFHDLVGNVWEICTGSPAGPVLRGGSWQNKQERVLRFDYSSRSSPEADYAETAGFRCVLAPEK